MFIFNTKIVDVWPKTLNNDYLSHSLQIQEIILVICTSLFFLLL